MGRTSDEQVSRNGVMPCALHRRLDDALVRFEEAFRRSTLADVLADSNPGVPLCDIEVEPGRTSRRRAAKS